MLGRIHDGKDAGVAFSEDGKGRMEDCQVWGNVKAGVYIQGDGSEAVLVGCKYVAGRGGSMF